jgi:uncharacterized protein
LKIILSPSKTQSLACPLGNCTKPLFNREKTLFLFDTLKELDEGELGSLFKIKGKLLDYTYSLYQSFDVDGSRFDPISCYDGVVYEALGNGSYTTRERNFLEEHLVVISAMYGILEGGMGIWPYRLDFKTRPQNINLYEYWQNEVLKYFSGVDTIINLASEEFSSILKPIWYKVVNINFLEVDGRVLSYKVKKARGLMAEAIIKGMILDVSELKSMVIGDYRYDESCSDEYNYYFKKGGVL